MIIEEKAYARAGLLGNPSDGFGGRVLAVTIQNWQAKVKIWESPNLEIRPNPVHDPMIFRDGLEQLDLAVSSQGYYGGLRLILAACRRFYQWRHELRLHLPKINFTLEYDTNIPRNVGLAGSSAIVTAVIKALIRFYGISYDQFELAELPNLILAVETEELGITAGLMDRVIQVYDGLVYMDFGCVHMERCGYGQYERLNPDLLPPMFVVWDETYGKPENSGGVHRSMRQRWEEFDPIVMRAMSEFASIAQDGTNALEAGDIGLLARYMSDNFNLRRELYRLSDDNPNVRMVKIAAKHNCAVKQTGSGGAIIGIKPASENWLALQNDYEANGFKIVEAILPELRNDEK